jgi:hypothetical protein
LGAGFLRFTTFLATFFATFFGAAFFFGADFFTAFLADFFAITFAGRFFALVFFFDLVFFAMMHPLLEFDPLLITRVAPKKSAVIKSVHARARMRDWLELPAQIA